MSQRDRLLRLLGLLYAAPGRAEGWNAFLLALNNDLHGSGASLIIHGFGRRHATVPMAAGMAPEALADYARHWGACDPWQHSPLTRGLGPGSVTPGEALVREAELLETAFYRDFGRHFDVGRCLAGTVEVGPDGASVFSVNRPQCQRPFDGADQALVRVLIPHLQRAIQLNRRLADAEALASTALAAIEGLSHGVLLVSGTGAVRHANATARAILAARDGLYSDNGELRTLRHDDTARLRMAISTAASVVAGAGTSASGTMRLGRTGGRQPLVVLVCPLTSGPRVGLGESAPVGLFTTDPERGSDLHEHDLVTEYYLTQAEARLAIQLAMGHDLESAARRLGVAPATVKSNLKSVFEKTGCRRQSELVRVLLATPPVTRGRL